MSTVTNEPAISPTPEPAPGDVPADRKYDADVIVIGAGPAGSSAAYWMASAGLDVLLLEKTTFPREKVCGDGLTPRGTRALVDMGIDVSTEAGWLHNKGLRVVGGGYTLELPWPELTTFPNYGLVRPRADLDALLANQAVKAGARLHEQTNVSGPITDRTGRVVGVTARVGARVPGKEQPEVEYRAPIVLSCDGVSGRIALALGMQRNEKRPMGVAVRRYYKSPRTNDDWLESHLDLWDGPPNQPTSSLLPGYGWIFGMGDGTVNVGLGLLNSSSNFQKTNYRAMLTSWLDNTPEEWGLREENAIGTTQGAGLPMGFNRTPHYRNGLLLVGDTGGSVNPYNGEGIPYAMESGKFAAEAVVQALARPEGPSRELALEGYATRMTAEWGKYYRAGGLFVKLVGNPKFMGFATQHAMKRPRLMQYTLKMLANLTDPKARDIDDRIINGIVKMMPPVK